MSVHMVVKTRNAHACFFCHKRIKPGRPAVVLKADCRIDGRISLQYFHSIECYNNYECNQEEVITNE